MNKSFLVTLFASFFLLSTVIFAGGSSFTIKETSSGEKVFQAGEKGATLANFTIKPTNASIGDLDTLGLSIICSDAVIESASLYHEGELVDEAILSSYTHNTANEQLMVFANGPAMTYGVENNLEIKVDFVDEINHSFVSCRQYKILFEYLNDADEQAVLDHDSAGLGGLVLDPIYFDIDEDAEAQFEAGEVEKEPVIIEFGEEGFVEIGEYTIESPNEGLLIDSMLLTCENGTFKDFNLEVGDADYAPTTFTVDQIYHIDQVNVFRDLGLELEAGVPQNINLMGQIYSHQYTPYLSPAECDLIAIDAFDKTGTSIDYRSIQIQDSHRAVRVYHPDNLTGFDDVSDSHPNYDAVKYLRQFGIVNGYSDETFRPDNEISRAEFSKMLIYVYEFLYTDSIYPEDLDQNCFSDVEEEEWYSKSVCAAKDAGWVQGYPDETFKPNQQVNFVEALKMTLVSQKFEVTDGETVWHTPYVEKGEEVGITALSDNNLDLGKMMTRGEVSQMIYDVLVYFDSHG